MKQKLELLVNNGQLKSFEFREQICSMEGDARSRLIDELLLVFPNGEKLEFTTFCSGCLENTSLSLK